MQEGDFLNVYMNNLDPSMAQPTLPVWVASPCVHIQYPHNALALSYFNTQFVMLTLGKALGWALG